MDPREAVRNGWHYPSGPLRAGAWKVQIAMAGLPLQACSVLLSRGAEHVVVDTGFCSHDSVLVDGLERAGVKPEQITAVINTHFHLDHIGCNALFAQAQVYTSRTDYDWAVPIYESVCGGETRRTVFRTFYPQVTDEEFERMDQARLLQLICWLWDPAMLGDMSRYHWIEEQPLPFEGLRVVPTPGHTPGHIALEVDGEDGPYLIAGDARSFQDDATVGLDMPPHNEALYRQSRQLLDAFRGIIIPGHDEPFRQDRPAAEQASSQRAGDSAGAGASGRPAAAAAAPSQPRPAEAVASEGRSRHAAPRTGGDH